MQVESYPVGKSIRYAVIFRKDGGPKTTAYHGRTAKEHQSRMDNLTKKGWRPKNVSVVSLNGKRFYTALYEKRSIGSFVARSFLTSSEYQKQFDQNLKKGRLLAYLNVYQHKGVPRFSAIWNSKTKGTFKARHTMSGSQYQTEWNKARSNALLTRAVSGYASKNGTTRYAAMWRR